MHEARLKNAVVPTSALQFGSDVSHAALLVQAASQRLVELLFEADLMAVLLLVVDLMAVRDVAAQVIEPQVAAMAASVLADRSPVALRSEDRRS